MGIVLGCRVCLGGCSGVVEFWDRCRYGCNACDVFLAEGRMGGMAVCSSRAKPRIRNQGPLDLP